MKDPLNAPQTGVRITEYRRDYGGLYHPTTPESPTRTFASRLLALVNLSTARPSRWTTKEDHK